MESLAPAPPPAGPRPAGARASAGAAAEVAGRPHHCSTLRGRCRAGALSLAPPPRPRRLARALLFAEIGERPTVAFCPGLSDCLSRRTDRNFADREASQLALIASTIRSTHPPPPIGPPQPLCRRLISSSRSPRPHRRQARRSSLGEEEGWGWGEGKEGDLRVGGRTGSFNSSSSSSASRL